MSDTNGNSTSNITVEGATATIRVTDQSNSGVSGAIVTFKPTGGVKLGNMSGTVLTNIDGYATISLIVEDLGDIKDSPAYKISASVEYNDKVQDSKSTPFTVSNIQIQLGELTIGTGDNPLSSGGSTNVALQTLNNGNAQNNIPVTFTASCGTFEPTSVISINQGNVTSTYKALHNDGKLCEGEVQLFASSPNSSSSATKSIKVDSIQADSIVYTTSSAIDLGKKSSGSASSGVIEFTIYSNGNPVQDKNVQVKLTNSPEGLTFVTLGNTDVKTLKSDSTGKVRINLYPGDTPGPVEIEASLIDNPLIKALSKNVKISTGRATQSGFTFSPLKQSLRTDINGDSAILEVRLVDKTNNPVPKGTVVSFISEGGKVDPNCSTNEEGVCTVTLTTQNPRPSDNRVSILAYVEGDKDYTDINNDKLYSPSDDTLTSNIGDFFLDSDEDQDPSVGEFIYKKASGLLGCAPTNILYLNKQPNITGTCNNELGAILRQQIIVAFAHDTPTFVWNSGFESNGKITSGSGDFNFQIFGNTERNVPMPSGTNIAVEVKDNTDNGLSCEAEIRSGNLPVPDVFDDLLTPQSFRLASNTRVKYTVRLRKCGTGDDIKIITSVPGGKTVTSWLDIK